MKLLKNAFFWIAVLFLSLLYWFGFHKHFDGNYIHQNADEVVMADVKNIRNFFVFSYLKNPSKWKKGLSYPKKKRDFDISDYGIKTPDYLAVFHVENQPESVFYCVAEIADETIFSKTIIAAQFAKTTVGNGFTTYYSKRLGILIVKHLDKILCSNVSEKQQKTAIKIAEDLFLKNQFLDQTKIEKTIDTKNAITIWLKKNTFLEEDGIVNIDFEEHQIIAHSKLKIAKRFLKENQFSQNESALLSLGFGFEMIRNQKFLKNNATKINKAIGFDLDSILSRNPSKTELVLNEIIEKKDSAISYEYDDDFNPIEKVTVHKTHEPSFLFSMQYKDPKHVFSYLKVQKAINKEHVFVNFPLAKTSASIMGSSFVLKANTPKNGSQISTQKRIAFLHVNLNKLGQKEWDMVLKRNKNFRILQGFSSLSIDFIKENNLGDFQLKLKTKKNKSQDAILLDEF